MKTAVVYVNSGIQRHAEGSNRAVEVHVKQSILVIPEPGRRVGYLVSHEPNAIVARVRLKLIDCGAGSCPRLDSRLHLDRRADRRKIEKCRAAAD